jgi:thymidylate kinase
MMNGHLELTDVPPLLRAAFDSLDGSGSAWVMLRDSGSGVSASGDVDILVESAAAARLDSLFANLGYRRLPGAGQGSHRFYLGYDIADDTFVTLDIVTEVAFGRRLEFLTAAASSLLARAGRVYGVNVLAADDAFWHLLLHYLLDKRSVPPGGHGRLVRTAVAATPGGRLAETVDSVRPAGLNAADILALVRGGDTQAVDALAGALRRAWRTKDHRRVRSRLLRSRLEQAHILRSPGHRSIGMSIAILGPDGAGKTTLASGLVASVPLPSRLVYMGVWREYPWDRWVRWLPGARLGLRLARLAARAVECQYHRLRGRIVFLDRFTYDAALPTPELDWRGRVTAAMVRRLSSEPDLVLVLDAPAEVMYARKGEQGVPVLARDRTAYLRLAKKHPAATVIDASLPPSQVRQQAHLAFWRAVLEGAAVGGKI